MSKGSVSPCVDHLPNFIMYHFELSRGKIFLMEMVNITLPELTYQPSSVRLGSSHSAASRYQGAHFAARIDLSFYHQHDMGIS